MGKFIGIDKCLETSLFEYGLVCKYNPTDDDYFCLFKISDDVYDYGYQSVENCDSLINGTDWMSSDDIESFLSTQGMTKEEWLDLQPTHKIYDLYSYYGFENIFGSSMVCMSKDEILSEYAGELEITI